MGSANVQQYADRDQSNMIHVAWSVDDRLWWAVGRIGSYGSSLSRYGAECIARDVVVSTNLDGIVVHTRHGAVQYVIPREKIRQKPSSQFFQDDVK